MSGLNCHVKPGRTPCRINALYVYVRECIRERIAELNHAALMCRLKAAVAIDPLEEEDFGL